MVLAIFAGGFWLIYRTVHSPFGQVLKAIRENEPRALSLGYDVDRYKLLAFVLSAALAGLAGATKTLVLGFATLTDVHWQTSGEVVLMTLVGGVGTIVGPVIGAGVIITLQNELADKVGPWVTVIMGVIFVVCVLLFRRGIVGELVAWQKRRAVAHATSAASGFEGIRPMRQAHDEGRDSRQSLGAFNPVGHVVLAFANDEIANDGRAVTLLQGRGFADPRTSWTYTSAELFPNAPTSMIRKASGAAGFGYEINLMRRYLTLAGEGAGWLVVHAPDDDPGRQGSRQIAKRFGAKSGGALRAAGQRRPGLMRRPARSRLQAEALDPAAP